MIMLRNYSFEKMINEKKPTLNEENRLVVAGAGYASPPTGGNQRPPAGGYEPDLIFEKWDYVFSDKHSFFSCFELFFSIHGKFLF